MNQLDHIVKEWIAARSVIAAALKELGMSVPEARAEAIIARLASHKPPILLSMEDDNESDHFERSERNAKLLERELAECRLLLQEASAQRCK